MRPLIATLVGLFLAAGMVGGCVTTTTERPSHEAQATERPPQAP